MSLREQISQIVECEAALDEIMAAVERDRIAHAKWAQETCGLDWQDIFRRYYAGVCLAEGHTYVSESGPWSEGELAALGQLNLLT